MKTRRTKTIGVVVADLRNPFYPESLDELTRELDSAGYRVVLWNAGGGSHRDALSAIREHSVDGVIFTTATADSVELQTAIEKNSPIVLINRIVEGLDCDQVVSSNIAGGSVVADYLISHQKTHVAFIGGTDNASTSRDRGAGFFNRMAAQGHPVPETMRFRGEFSRDTTYQLVTDLLSGPGGPEAIFCANDYMAFAALDAARSNGLLVPDNCWIIGYDDVDMAAWDSFSLTTVRQPSREMARAGASMLLERIHSPGSPARRMEFPCELIVRKSTT